MLFRNLKLVTVLLALELFISSCAVNQRQVKQTDDQVDNKKYQELIRQGDDFFIGHHLYGWRRAAALYEEAYRIKKTPQLRDKIFLTLGLIIIREKDEKIITPLVYERVDKLGNFQLNPRQEYLHAIIQDYRNTPIYREKEGKLRAKTKRPVNIGIFDIHQNPLDAYLYLYYLNYFSYDFSVYNKELAEIFKSNDLYGMIRKYEDALSPLFIYSNFKPSTPILEAGEKDPYFAELFYLIGNHAFKKNNFRKAARYFEKALNLIPDYTKALNGIANILYFTVQNYAEALEYYEKTLALDPVNPVALFGKGVSLHHLNRLTASSAVFDKMLAIQPLHHGEAYYYKAYNYYFLENIPKAIELVEKAKILLPRSGEAHFLSGLLYFGEGKMKKAEADFLKVLWDDSYAQSYPLYYLGTIKLKAQNWDFIDDFSDAITSFKDQIKKMEKTITEIDNMSIDEKHKEWMKQDKGKKFARFQERADELILQMEAIIQQNRGNREKYRGEIINKELKRIKALLRSNPSLLDSRNKDGSPLLHQAIEKGQRAVVEFLLEKGASLELSNNEGYSPLHWAVLTGQEKIVKLLIRKGANVKITNPAGYTPLHDAAHTGHEGITRLLIAKGADCYVKEKLERTPLDLAIRENQTHLYHLLKPLHIAVQQGNLSQIRSLINQRAEAINSRDDNGQTPLHLAVISGSIEICQYLIDKGAHLNTKDFDGHTPLEKAELNRNQRIISLLLSRGAQEGNRKILQRDLESEQAFLWFLNTHGWAIKTKNYFFIFNYRQPYFLPGIREPVQPSLATGQIHPVEISTQKAMVFVTDDMVNRRNPHMIFEWKKTIKDIHYFLGWGKPPTSYIKSFNPGQRHRIEGIDIQSTKQAISGVGFFIKADGLKIFYPGIISTRDQQSWEEFKKEIKILQKEMETVDIALISLTDGSSQLRTNSFREAFYLVEMLRPKEVFFTCGRDRQDLQLQLKKELIRCPFWAKQARDTTIHFIKVSGDRFFFGD
jgi:ankyrin repeat protein/Flp pilus assembly protein TadD